MSGVVMNVSKLSNTHPRQPTNTQIYQPSLTQYDPSFIENVMPKYHFSHTMNLNDTNYTTN